MRRQDRQPAEEHIGENAGGVDAAAKDDLSSESRAAIITICYVDSFHAWGNADGHRHLYQSVL